MFYAWMATPIGRVMLARSERGLRRIELPCGGRAAGPDAGWTLDHAALGDAVEQIAAYLDGERTGFDLPLDPVGTEFQLRCWRALAAIPYGETITYGEQARRIGSPGAARAVGAANGANPLPIVVPCHRVIGASGSLVGFGGGIETKRYLLALESAQRAVPMNGDMS